MRVYSLNVLHARGCFDPERTQLYVRIGIWMDLELFFVLDTRYYEIVISLLLWCVIQIRDNGDDGCTTMMVIEVLIPFLDLGEFVFLYLYLKSLFVVDKTWGRDLILVFLHQISQSCVVCKNYDWHILLNEFANETRYLDTGGYQGPRMYTVWMQYVLIWNVVWFECEMLLVCR